MTNESENQRLNDDNDGDGDDDEVTCFNFRRRLTYCTDQFGKVISLHRYPANVAIRRIWLQRSRLVRKDFVYTANSQMCSQHFVNFNGPSKDHPLPSVFPNKVFKISVTA
uniref:THAP-type domain-containing protein n=1 Tax=Octopus bimaculoides TaxID=37653 RepID=A0A0L8FQ40_OCTBM